MTTKSRPDPEGRDPAGQRQHPDVAVTIIVPIHDAYDDAMACIASVLAHTQAAHLLLLVDDASTDARVSPALHKLAAEHPRTHVMRNRQRLGYTASINRACRRAKGDVLLLNSDTLVSDGWLTRLSQVARSQREVATVTALSNAAGSFSIPELDRDNTLPPGVSVDEMATMVAALSPRNFPLVPTGHGFCMYVRRAALEALDFFDEAAFPDGYGEENDFCFRATQAGFIHLVDDRTFIFHRRGASYGSRREALLERNLATLHERHPEAAGLIAAWRKSLPFELLARRVRSELARRAGRVGTELTSAETQTQTRDPTQVPSPAPPPAHAPEPILYILHAGFGGVQNTTNDLIRSVGERHPCIVLTTGLHEWTVRVFPAALGSAEHITRFSTPWRLGLPLDEARMSELRRVVKQHGIRLAHIRHFLGNAPEIVELFGAQNIPVVFSVHDYHALCPTVKLLDERGQFCAGHCTAGAGDCPGDDNQVAQLPALKHRYVREWQRRTGRALMQCDSLITTSPLVREIMLDVLPLLRKRPWQIIEHGRSHREFSPSARLPSTGRPVVLFFGQLTSAKGADVLRRLCELNREAGSPFELEFLGTGGDLEFEQLGVRWHGDYRRDELPARLAAIRPSLTLIPSQWPETYCHVLTESWAAGIPVLASDLGALGERVRKHGGGWLINDVGRAAAWFEKLRDLLVPAGDEYQLRLKEAVDYKPASVSRMATEYLTVYAAALEAARETEIRVDRPSPRSDKSPEGGTRLSARP